MKIKDLIVLSSLICSLTACTNNSKRVTNYSNYHAKIIAAEEHISKEEYEKAITLYEETFENFDFIFLRDRQVLTQLYLFTGDMGKGLASIKKGITNGWELQDLKDHKILQDHLGDTEWQVIEEQYDDLHKQFLNRIDSNARKEVQLMFQKDQELAMTIALMEDESEQEEYVMERFPSHSESQLRKLIDHVETKGYSGEFLIGNNFWASTILSHHNSIAQDYVEKDTLYEFIKPKLTQSLKKGYLSPYEFALMEDWKKAVLTDGEESIYGYLKSPNESNIKEIDEARSEIGLRSIELRNKLIDIEEKTGIDLHLPDWVDGKIIIENTNLN